MTDLEASLKERILKAKVDQLTREHYELGLENIKKFAYFSAFLFSSHRKPTKLIKLR